MESTDTDNEWCYGMGMSDSDVFDPWAVKDEPLVPLGTRIRECRKTHGMSQSELADAMQAAGHPHWRQNTVSRVEQGKQEPSMHEVATLNDLLGDVLAGTVVGVKMHDTMTQVQGAVRSAATRKQLEEVERQLQESLAAIRELRRLHDPAYRRATRVGDDGER